MSFEIIKNRLDQLGINREDFGYRQFPKDDEILGEWEIIHREGGEGKGEEWCSVTHFKKYDVYIEIDGHYQSYHGTDFDNDYYEVKPEQQTITVYKPTNK